jgi:hypothetical protein
MKLLHMQFLQVLTPNVLGALLQPEHAMMSFWQLRSCMVASALV